MNLMDFTSSAYFGIALTLICFTFASMIYSKFKSPFLTPVVTALIFIIAILKIFKIPAENYSVGGNMISVMLTPATAVLAVSIYKQLDILKKNLLPVLVGVFVGSLTSVFSVLILCKLFGLENGLTAAMLPKSVTTPIAIELSEQHGGIVSVTVACVMITGIFGAIFSPILIKLFNIKDSVAAGIAIGTSSHALGTSKAIEIGELEGAMSGVSIGVAGLITSLILIFI